MGKSRLRDLLIVLGQAEAQLQIVFFGLTQMAAEPKEMAAVPLKEQMVIILKAQEREALFKISARPLQS